MNRIETLPFEPLAQEAISGEIAEKLAEIDFTGKNILFICEDGTRRAPVATFFPELFSVVSDAANQVTVLIANGTHRAMTEDELIRKIGIDTNGVRVFNHDAYDETRLTRIGEIDGQEVKVNTLLSEHDIIIGIGSITPHRVMGFSGGAKLLLPGIADAASVAFTHWKSNQYAENLIVGNISNPVREVIDRVPSMIEKLFGVRCLLINCVVSGSDIAGIFVGSFDDVYKKGAALTERLFVRRVEPCSSILALVPPSAVDFWQAAKAVYNCARVINQGGKIVVSGEMPEGISAQHPEIEQFGYSSRGTIEALVKSGLITDVLAASHMVRVSERLERVRIYLSSPNINPETCRTAGLDYVSPGSFQADDFDYVVENAIDTLLVT